MSSRRKLAEDILLRIIATPHWTERAHSLERETDGMLMGPSAHRRGESG